MSKKECREFVRKIRKQRLQDVRMFQLLEPKNLETKRYVKSLLESPCYSIGEET